LTYNTIPVFFGLPGFLFFPTPTVELISAVRDGYSKVENWKTNEKLE